MSRVRLIYLADSETWAFQGDENACRCASPRIAASANTLAYSCFRLFDLPLLAASPATGHCTPPPTPMPMLLNHDLICCAVLVPSAREADGVGYFQVQRAWVYAVTVK